jgi:predicted nicotinamide N-methyase
LTERLVLGPVRAVPELVLYAAHPGSGLKALAAEAGIDGPPYWAYAWSGGLALARHLLDHPALVAGRRVLDLGAGSGLVAIAAAKAGARSVVAVDIDPFAAIAIRMNAAANGVGVALIRRDITTEALPEVDLVLAGDVLYDAEVSARMLPFLERCQEAGIDVLIGDPGRRGLPAARLSRIADYPVGDMGEPTRIGSVFSLLPAESRGSPETR